MSIVSEKLKTDPDAHEALQFLLAQNYLEMGKEIGNSESSKVMFMDPRSMISTIEGVQSVISQNNHNGSQKPQMPVELDIKKIERDFKR